MWIQKCPWNEWITFLMIISILLKLDDIKAGQYQCWFCSKDTNIISCCLQVKHDQRLNKFTHRFSGDRLQVFLGDEIHIAPELNVAITHELMKPPISKCSVNVGNFSQLCWAIQYVIKCTLHTIAQCCKVLRKKKHKHLHNWKWKVPGNFPHLVTSSLQAEGISTLRIPLNTENRLVVLPIIK